MGGEERRGEEKGTGNERRTSISCTSHILTRLPAMLRGRVDRVRILL